MEKYNDLDSCFRDVWNKMYRGAVKAKDDFHLPALATTDGEKAGVRTVVLRETDTENYLLTCYSDIRAVKTANLKIYPQATWLFWSKKLNLQIRASGKSTVMHLDETARAHWDKISPRSRKDYCSKNAPGTEIDSPRVTETHPDWWGESDMMTQENTDFGFDNFAVITSIIDDLDVLQILKEGHRRARFCRQREDWEKSWVIP